MLMQATNAVGLTRLALPAAWWTCFHRGVPSHVEGNVRVNLRTLRLRSRSGHANYAENFVKNCIKYSRT